MNNDVFTFIYICLQLQNAPSNEILRSLLMQERFTFIMDCGYLKPFSTVTINDVTDIAYAVFMEYVVNRSGQELSQFIDGLETLGVTTLIKSNPQAMKQLFVYDAGSKRVTPSYILDLFVPCLSPRGHNQREDEEDVILNWNDYVQDCEGITLILNY